jgi:DNA-binding transcriptional regulator YbjK
MVMLDQLVRSTLTHLPEIPAAQHKERFAAGERRHRDWQGHVADLLRQMRSEAAKERPVVSGNGAHA